MAARKTRDLFVVQSNWGYGHGWEDVAAATTRKEARADLKAYRENEPQVPHRLVVKRERIQLRLPGVRDPDDPLYPRYLHEVRRELETGVYAKKGGVAFTDAQIVKALTSPWGRHLVMDGWIHNRRIRAVAKEIYRTATAGTAAYRRDPSAPYSRGKNKIRIVMKEFEAGKLRSSSGQKVTSLRQARAIALSEQRRAEKRTRPARTRGRELRSRRDCSCTAKPLKSGRTKIEFKHFHSRNSERDPAARCPVGTEVQTVLLSQHYFSPRNADSWIKRHGFHVKKVDVTENMFRFRQKEPSAFQPGSFRTIRLRPGVEAVIGCPRS